MLEIRSDGRSASVCSDSPPEDLMNSPHPEWEYAGFSINEFLFLFFYRMEAKSVSPLMSMSVRR